jgi:hypothetical protein
VASKRSIPVLLAAATIAFLAGCGGGSTANVQNPPPPPPSNLSIAFQPEPGGTLAVSFTENLTAVVTNDAQNLGVDWSLTCPNPQNIPSLCGSLSALHTASGTATTFTAPSAFFANSMDVEIVAYAAANHNTNTVAPILITSFTSGLQAGNYVLQAQGVDSSLSPYQIAAAITLDGQGNVTGGEQTANYAATGSLSDKINPAGSNYFIGSDGRGSITLQTGDNKIGGNGVETFASVFLNNSNGGNPQALISQMDLGSAATGASATGTLSLQASAPTAPLGGYAFVVNGTDVANVNNPPVAFGGVLNIDSANTISGNGSVTDEILGKKVNATAVGVSGTLTAPDQFGVLTLNLTAPFGTAGKPVSLQFTGYIVDGSHIQLIETDAAAGAASPFGLTAGPAIGQGTATGTFTGNASFTGTYVFGIPGVDLSNSNLAPSTLTSAGLFTADGAGNLTNGFTDTFLDLNGTSETGAQISAPFTGTYSVDSSGTGRASLTSITFTPEPKFGYNPMLFFYLTGTGSENTPLVLEGGDTHYPSVGTGIAYPQSAAAPAFSGDYGLRFTQELEGSENDGTGQWNANSTTPPPSLSGAADVNISGANQDQPFTGTFAAPTAATPFPGTLLGTTNNTVSSAVFSPQITVDYYFIDASHGFFIETDLLTPGAQQNGQVSLGYYAERTPVCSGCP